eukprot:gene24235-10295_t
MERRCPGTFSAGGSEQDSTELLRDMFSVSQFRMQPAGADYRPRGRWSVSRGIVGTDERSHRLCEMIRQYPKEVLNHFGYVCDAMNQWEPPTDGEDVFELRNEFRTIMFKFKEYM